MKVVARSFWRLDRRSMISGATILGALLVAMLWQAYRSAQAGFYGQSIFPPKSVYNFQLTDQNSAPLRLSDLSGSNVLLVFGFVHCPNVCPTTLTDLADCYRALNGGERAQTRVLFVSVDPDRDDPATLRNYLGFFDKSFTGATGAKAEIDRLTQDLGATYELEKSPGKQTTDYNVNHSAYIYVLDRKGALELLYTPEKLTDTSKVAGDLRKLISRQD